MVNSCMESRSNRLVETHIVSLIQLALLTRPARKALRRELDCNTSHREAIRRMHETGQADSHESVSAVHVRKKLERALDELQRKHASQYTSSHGALLSKLD